MKTPYRVGLTGGIGSGKSTVAAMFSERGVPVLDADELAHKAVLPGSEAYIKIRDLFGENVISETGELRRDYLREIVFNDRNKREQLENIIHPVVRQMMEDAIEQLHTPYCILSVPLLLESGSAFDVDEIIVVNTTEKLQIERTCRRDNVTGEDVKKIINSQMPGKERLKYADEIITNDASLEELESQVDRLHQKYLDKTGQISQ